MTLEIHKSKQITVNFRHLLTASVLPEVNAERGKHCILTTFFVAGETLRGTFV